MKGFISCGELTANDSELSEFSFEIYKFLHTFLYHHHQLYPNHQNGSPEENLWHFLWMICIALDFRSIGICNEVG